MKKVSEVRKELEELKQFDKMLCGILSGMDSNFETAQFMSKTFGVSKENLRKLESYISVREMNLRHQLDECMVDM